MEQSPSWEAESHSANQDTFHLLWNLKVHKSLPLVPILRHMNPHIWASHGSKDVSVVLGYVDLQVHNQRFGEMYCLHQPWRWRQYVSPKCWPTYKSTWRHNREEKYQQMNPVHILPLYFQKIHFNIILPSMARSTEWSFSLQAFQP
jgi:hypothetical protein